MNPARLARVRLIALDFETTGASPAADRVVEIGVAEVHELRVTATWSSLVHPERPIPPRVSAIHGIGDADVADSPRFAEVAGELLARVAGADAIVCHNAPFDMRFLQRELLRTGHPPVDRPVIDTLAAARAAWGRGENSLAEVAARFGVSTRTLHRAGADALITAEVLIAFACHLGERFPMADFPGFVPDGRAYLVGAQA